MVCTKMANLYEKYKTKWMLENGITIDDYIKELDNYREAMKCDMEYNSIEDVAIQWEVNEGFGGELWACYDEWQDTEFFEELCDRIRDKVHIDWKEENLVFHTPIDNHENVVLSPDESHDDWGEIIAEFILYGDYATSKNDKSEKFRSILITWLWLNDEKGGAY